MTEAEDRIQRAYMLGAALEKQEKREVAEIFEKHKDRIEEAAVQLDAAHLCITQALEILRSVPKLEQSMLTIMISLINVQVQGYRDTLRRKR